MKKGKILFLCLVVMTLTSCSNMDKENGAIKVDNEKVEIKSQGDKGKNEDKEGRKVSNENGNKVDKSKNEKVQKPDNKEQKDSDKSKVNNDKLKINNDNKVPQQNKYNIFLNEMNFNKTSTVSLETTFNEAIDKFKSLGFKNLNWGDEYIMVEDEKTKEEVATLMFAVTSRTNRSTAKMLSITVNPEKIPTSLGLKAGDSVKRMEELYGKNYTSYMDKTSKRTIYDYKINNYIFSVQSAENNKDKVLLWGISVPK